jgi:hypothetical protein
MIRQPSSMPHDKPKAARPPRLHAEIAALEKRILERRLSLRRDTRSFGLAIRKRMTSPAMLLAAGGFGVLLSALTSRRRSALGPWARKLASGALRFVALFRAFVPALRLIPDRTPG